MGNMWYIFFPRGDYMKQMHLRVDDALYEELNTYSVETEQSMQACVREAVAYYITDKKKKQIPVLKSQFTFIDLFAGIGGMRLAYENVGGRCVYSNEWNKYSQQTYYANFGEQPEGDITKVDAKTIPDHDILVAGFPCQPFSIAGVSKKISLGRKTGFEDKTQGTLFFDVCRILKEKRPKAFMLENVKNLKSHDKGRTFKTILESLDELKYKVFFPVLDGQNFVPQHRERIIIVGYTKLTVNVSLPMLIKLVAQNAVDSTVMITVSTIVYVVDISAQSQPKFVVFGEWR